MPQILHVWDVDINQPCSPTGTYGLYTSTGDGTVPYAVSSGYSLSSAHCQCGDVYHWIVTYSKPGSVNFTNLSSFPKTSTPLIGSTLYASTPCACSASGTAKWVSWNVTKHPETQVQVRASCKPIVGLIGSENCPTNTSKPYRIKVDFDGITDTAGGSGRTCNWKLYKPKNQGNHKHTWGTVITHTSVSDLTCSECNSTERITFTDVGS